MPIEMENEVVAHEEEAQKAAPCKMKVRLSREDLLRGLELVMKSVSTRANFPAILKHIQIQAEADRVTLSGTNLATGILVQVAAQIVRTGTYTINAKLLLDCVKTFPRAESITLEVKEERVVMSCGKRSFSLKDGSDGKDFPDLNAEMTPDNFCVIEVSRFQQAIKEVQFAAGDDDGRPVYTCVRLHMTSDSVTLSTADGYRLAERRIQLDETVQGRDATLLIPVGSMRLLSSVLPKNSEVALTWSGERITFQAGTMRFVTILHESTFPTVDLPKRHKTTFTLERSDLLSLLASFRPFTRESSHILRLFYTSESVTFKAESDELGDASDELATEVEGANGQIILNAKYLAHVLSAIEAPTFTFRLSGYGMPCLICPVGREDYRYALMPMDPNGK